MSTTIDTLRFYERLKKADMPDSSARELAEMFKESNEVLSSELATKKDLELGLAASKKDLELGLAASKKDLELGLATLRESVLKEIEKSKSDMIKWVAGMLVAQAALIAALVKLL